MLIDGLAMINEEINLLVLSVGKSQKQTEKERLGEILTFYFCFDINLYLATIS